MARNEQVLRAKVRLELKDKRQCAYQPYNCSHLNVEGSKFCLKHILQDKTAGFKQCNFIYQNSGKRCHLAASKSDKAMHGYCNEHSIKSALQKNKQDSANPPPVTAESLLSNLTLYLKQSKNLNSSLSIYENADNREEQGSRRTVQPPDPFAFDVNAILNERCNAVMDMCSDSETDIEPTTNSAVWHDAQADSSDNESIDSEQGDPLKHANVYTSEEISLKAKERLVKLQSRYADQFPHLLNQMREIRRKYIYNLEREKETCCNIFSQVRENPKEQKLFKKLKHYGNYNRSSGKDSVATKHLHDQRKRLLGVKFNFSRCIFTEDGVKCGQKTIFLAKHCRKHIIEDPNQALYVACGKVNFDVKCNMAVEGIFEDTACKIHKVFPSIRSYSQSRKDSESDTEDTLDLPPHYAMPTNDNIKAETIDYSLASLSKMETLPSLLFEDSAESLSSTLQYSASEFTEDFVEQNASDVQESSNTTDLNVVDNIKLEINKSAPISPKIVDESKSSNDLFQFKIESFNVEPDLEHKQEELNIAEETLTNKENSDTVECVAQIAENIPVPEEIETTNVSQIAENISVPEEIETASISQIAENISVPEEIETATVSQIAENISVPEEVETATVSQIAKNISVPEETETANVSQMAENISVPKETETANNVDVRHDVPSNDVGLVEEVNKSDEKMEVD